MRPGPTTSTLVAVYPIFVKKSIQTPRARGAELSYPVVEAQEAIGHAQLFNARDGILWIVRRGPNNHPNGHGTY